MLEFAIIASLAAAAYLDQPGWWVLVAAAGMTTASWWRKVRLLRQHPNVPFSSKMTTYLVVSIAINLAFATAGYVVGRAARLVFTD